MKNKETKKITPPNVLIVHGGVYLLQLTQLFAKLCGFYLTSSMSANALFNANLLLTLNWKGTSSYTFL